MKRHAYWCLFFLLPWVAGWAAEQPFPVSVLPPEILLSDGVEMTPVAPVAELLDASVSRDLLTGAITVERKGRRLQCRLESVEAVQNGRPITLARTPVFCDTVLYLPLRPLVETFGGTVKIVETAREWRPQVIMTVPGMPPVFCPARKARGDIDLHERDSQALYLVNTDGSGLRRLTYDSLPLHTPSFSPDGRTLLCIRHSNGLCLIDLTAAHQRPVEIDVETGGGMLTGISFSPDAQTLLGYCNYPQDILGRKPLPRIFIMRRDGTEMRMLDTGMEPCFSPDGRTIAYLRLRSVKKPILPVEPDPYAHAPVYHRRIEDVTVSEFCLMDADGKNVRKITMAADVPSWYSMRSDRTDLHPNRPAAGEPPLISLHDSTLFALHAGDDPPVRLADGLHVDEFILTPDGRRLLFTAMPPTLR